jgi:predicted enzyme related to lactoylglutathione lyase
MSIQGRVVWHDLYTADVEKSKRFYGELFNWRVQAEGDWNFIHRGNDKDHFGTIGRLPQPGMPTMWVPYIAVENLDAAMAAVTKAGGKMHTPKMAAGKSGHFAMAADPQQASFTLWQYNEGQPKPEIDGMPSMAESAGLFCWDELLTSDTEAAEKFYGQVIGYKTEHMEMPGMRYTLWLRQDKRPDGKPRQGGGMMKMPQGVPHPFWLSYVAVADCDQAVEKAKRLGANITSPPMDIPNVGRFSTMLDPTMAPIAVLGPGK